MQMGREIYDRLEDESIIKYRLRFRAFLCDQVEQNLYLKSASN